MRVQILGPLEILDAHGARVFVRGRIRRALLATLVVRAGRTVSIPRLIEELWGNTPPANAVNALQAHVGRLRRAIEEACGEAGRVLTHPTGYSLTLHPTETDAAEFTAQVAMSRTAAAPIPLLRSALSLWRGPALDGCTTGDICATEAAALEEARASALELLYAESLKAGHHKEVIAELERTTAAFPLRERFYDQLMEALCRADRQPDALAVYGRARNRLMKDLGVEPGQTLRTRAQAIRTSAPAPAPATYTDLTREVAELGQRIEALATRQAALLRQLKNPV